MGQIYLILSGRTNYVALICEKKHLLHLKNKRSEEIQNHRIINNNLLSNKYKYYASTNQTYNRSLSILSACKTAAQPQEIGFRKPPPHPAAVLRPFSRRFRAKQAPDISSYIFLANLVANGRICIKRVFRQPIPINSPYACVRTLSHPIFCFILFYFVHFWYVQAYR